MTRDLDYKEYMKYKSKYLKLKYLLQRTHHMVGGAEKYDEIMRFINNNDDKHDSVAKISPSNQMPATQSDFYMVVLTYAYCIVLHKDIEPELYARSWRVRKLLPEYSKEIFCALVTSVVQWLEQPTNMLHLEREYNKDQKPNTNLVEGHISGDEQEVILEASKFDNYIKYMILANIPQVAYFGIEDARTLFETIIQIYYENNKPEEKQEEEQEEKKDVLDFLTKDYKTDDQPEGDESLFFLDRHNVDCPNDDALTELRLVRNQDGTFSLKYKCATNLKSKNTRHTDYQVSNNGNVIYLDRHDIKCCDNEVLAGLKLERDPTNLDKVRYNYKCKPMDYKEVLKLRTVDNDSGQGKVPYLDRHGIKCPEKSLLKSMKLVNTDNYSKYHYEYECAKL